MNILIMTPVGRSDSGEWIDYFPSRWSYTTGAYKQNSYYPYNLAYLSAYLKQETDHDIRMIDANYYGVDSVEYIDIVDHVSPDLLIIEVDPIVSNKQMNIIGKLRADGFNGKIVLCGPYPTHNPSQVLRRGVDFVAMGEFEESILNLVKSNFSPDTLGVYPNGRAPLVPLNKLPFPENDDIRRKHYNRIHCCEYKELEIFSTRGCPFMCDFCAAVHVYYGKPSFRIRDVDSVTNEIKYLLADSSELEGIFFNEESHAINNGYISHLCDAIISEGLSNLKYECMANYSTFNKALLTKMRNAGYYKIRIGIETLEYDSSNFIAKNSDDKLLEVLLDCKELGIKVWSSLSMGTTGSTFEKDVRTLDHIQTLYDQNLLQDLSVSINTPLAGTPFYDKAIKENLIVNSTNPSFDGLKDTMINLPGYPSDKIREAFNRAAQMRNDFSAKNREKGIRYTAYDRDWCKEVYATTTRKVGVGILK